AQAGELGEEAREPAAVLVPPATTGAEGRHVLVEEVLAHAGRDGVWLAGLERGQVGECDRTRIIVGGWVSGHGPTVIWARDPGCALDVRLLRPACPSSLLVRGGPAG